MLKYSHPWLAVFVDYWPALILLPTVLLVVATLALITRWWDAKDEAEAEEQAALQAARDVAKYSVPAAGQ